MDAFWHSQLLVNAGKRLWCCLIQWPEVHNVLLPHIHPQITGYLTHASTEHWKSIGLVGTLNNDAVGSVGSETVFETVTHGYYFHHSTGFSLDFHTFSLGESISTRLLSKVTFKYILSFVLLFFWRKQLCVSSVDSCKYNPIFHQWDNLAHRKI